MFKNKNIRIYYLNTIRKIRNFLGSKKFREFLIFLFFVFVSFSFWLLQVLNDDYETEVSVPFRLKNVPENVVITSEPPTSLNVYVKDRGTVLINYLLGKTIYPVTVDFADISSRGNKVRMPVSDFKRKIATQFNQSTKLLHVKPDTLEFIYTYGQAKKVPVQLQGTVQLSKQYYLSDTIYSPDSVLVYAPKSILDTISSAFTEKVHLKNVSDTLRHRVNLSKITGARFVPPFVDVTLLSDVYSEKIVDVPVYGINFPYNKVLRTFPSHVSVAFQVGLRNFSSVVAEDFFVCIDYNDLTKNKKETASVLLKKSPEFLNHVRIVPSEVEYLIEEQVVYND